MVERQVHIVIDAAVDDAAVTGTVTSDRTAPRSFTGRLGLVTAIDRALTAVQETADAEVDVTEVTDTGSTNAQGRRNIDGVG